MVVLPLCQGPVIRNALNCVSENSASYKIAQVFILIPILQLNINMELTIYCVKQKNLQSFDTLEVYEVKELANSPSLSFGE